MDTEDHGGALVSRRALEIAVALGALAFGAIIILGAIEYEVGWSERGPEPGYFPFWMGSIVIVGALGTLVQAARRRPADVSVPALTRAQAKRVAAFLLPIVAFLLLVLVARLGLYVGMVLYLFAVMVWQGGYRLPVAAAISLATAVFFFLIFDRWLKVPLMKGPIEAWLGVH